MRWKKFHSILEQNPRLIHHIGNPGLACAYYLNSSSKKAEKVLKKWVQKHLDFIAFRPFEELDLRSENSINTEYIQVPDPERPVAFLWARTTYTVFFHIEGENEAPFRSRSVLFRHDDAFNTKEFSVREVILRIIAQYYLQWAKEGKEVHWDAVLKDTRHGDEEGTTHQKIEIFSLKDFSLLKPVT